MTLEEKIGQMCELTIGVVTDKNNNKLSEALLAAQRLASSLLKVAAILIP